MITQVTRRNIFDVIRVQKLNWAGRLEESEFLARIFDLDSMPSTDSRFKNAPGDIWQHRVNNPSDWDDHWVFSDKRFNLLRCDDEIFLRFLCEMLHPVVRDNKEEIERLQQLFNEYLRIDGYEIYQSTFISGYPVYSSKFKIEKQVSSDKAPVSFIVEPALKLPRQLRVFLCHSSDDKPTVRELYNKLETEGWIDAWLDEKKLYPGQDWNYEIEQAVEQADVILVCLTKNSVTKEGYVQRELRIILDFADYKPEGTLYIIPVRLEDCEPPKRIRRWQYADYFPEGHRNIAYQRLLESLKFRANHLGISTKLIQQKKENRPRPSVPPRSARVLGAITSAMPAALNARVTVLQGVGPTRTTALAELGLYTLCDMLYYYPQRYDNSSQRIIPIYSLPEGIPQKWFQNTMRQVVEYFTPSVVDALPESIRSAARLMVVGEALLQVHFPASQQKLRAALERLKFDEIFYLQMVLLRQKREWKSVYAKRFGITDVKLIEKARKEAQNLFYKDAELSWPEHSLLADALEQFWADSRGDESYFDNSIGE